MKIAMGSDHGGYRLKAYLVEPLATRGFEICEVWLGIGFDGGRHQRRVQKIHQSENAVSA